LKPAESGAANQPLCSAGVLKMRGSFHTPVPRGFTFCGSKRASASAWATPGRPSALSGRKMASAWALGPTISGAIRCTAACAWPAA